MDWQAERDAIQAAMARLLAGTPALLSEAALAGLSTAWRVGYDAGQARGWALKPEAGPPTP
jgi:hypothetical protein